jgi:ribosome-binding factor A
MKTLRPLSKTSSIKTAQKESAILRIISPLFDETVRENPDLQGWHVSRVQLSQGKAVAYVYVYTLQDEHDFKTALATIKLYKPSMRKALADELQKKYTPDIIFTFDEQLQRTLHMERLLDMVKSEESEE